MAASASEKDYVHRLYAKITEDGHDVFMRIRQCANWEFSCCENDLSAYAADRAFDADIVVFRLGENVASQNKPYFKETMKRFIEYICPHGTVIYTTCFWNNPIVDEAIKCVAVERGELCIDGCFSNNKDNMALGQFNHRGVAMHPSDKEMEEKKKYGRRAEERAVNVDDANGLFTDYCLKYIESKKSSLSKQVYYNYKMNYMKIFRGFFDKKKLRLIDITEKEIKAFYDQERKRGIKEITLKKYNNVLRPALKKAYRDKLIPDNPFEYLEPIHKEKTKISFYDKDEMRCLLQAIKGHPLEVPFTIAAYYGYRRSEEALKRHNCRGFCWCTTRVRRTPKFVGVCASRKI